MMQTYRQRAIRFVRILTHDDWQIKLYAISHDDAPVDIEDLDGGIALALTSLGTPAVTADRCGVAFIIAHRGVGIDYISIGWWDRQNELPLRVFVREAGMQWRPVAGSESVCVWDLQVVAFERDAYVRHMMRGEASSVQAYLSAHMEIDG